jgi:hypothetical protein
MRKIKTILEQKQLIILTLELVQTKTTKNNEI